MPSRRETREFSIYLDFTAYLGHITHLDLLRNVRLSAGPVGTFYHVPSSARPDLLELNRRSHHKSRNDPDWFFWVSPDRQEQATEKYRFLILRPPPGTRAGLVAFYFSKILTKFKMVFEF
jgi:hypothetical protein